MQEVDPRAVLRRWTDRHANQRTAARTLGISQAYLSDLLNGRRDIGEKLLRRLGLRRIVVKGLPHAAR